MNPIILEPQLKTKPEIQAETPYKQQYKFIGSIKMIPGLTLYSFNLETQEIIQVKVTKNVNVDFQKQKVVNDRVTYDPKLTYFQALNQANAEKKAIKIMKWIIDNNK